MGNPNDLDLGGMTIIAKDFKSGVSSVGQVSTSAQTSAAGGTLTASRATHAGKTILLDTASGSVVTLPAATGTGDTYRFLVTVSATTNNHIIKVANATDTMFGALTTATGATASGIMGSITANTGTVATESDTITMNGTTSGGKKGTVITLTDAATAVWIVSGSLYATGVVASVFSAGV